MGCRVGRAGHAALVDHGRPHRQSGDSRPRNGSPDRAPGPRRQGGGREFLERRCAGQPVQSLAKLFPRHGYDKDEIVKDGGFQKTFGKDGGLYVGKIYKDGSTEVISMGLEQLYKNPTKFAQTDPDYYKFMLGILDGTGRKR